MSPSRHARLGLALVVACAAAAGPRADSSRPAAPSAAAYVPDLAPLMGGSSSELEMVIERYLSDRSALLRRYSVEHSPERQSRMKEFYSEWQARLRTLDFDALKAPGRIDYVLFDLRLSYELDLLAREAHRVTEMAPLIPFASTIIALNDARRRLETIDPKAAATTLDRMHAEIEKTRRAVEAGLRPESKTTTDSGGNGQPQNGGAHAAPDQSAKPAGGEVAPIGTTKIVALRAAEELTGLRQTLEQWQKYYAGYDPMFTWWTSAPSKKTDEALRGYVKLLRERIVGYKEGEDEPIVGDPIGTDSLLGDLRFELIPYTPDELVAIANKEFAWCEAEMLKASREMGLGDDWRAALEKVKNDHVEPGRQVDLIRDLAIEATEYVRTHDLVTVPPLAADVWRTEMMSPEAQKVSPFFLGGEVIRVSYPTDTMAHDDKLMSLRGNNRHFARATVHHELIPGHHLQGFMTERHSRHRRAFSTPFWGEGWALYWEMLLWDMNFQQSPENRVGMLFWRMHRAARIIFSLSFHLGKMTPQECIDFLVDRVGHERANAEAEVRRSFNGSYSPLYQVAYMIGGLQFRALHRDLVQSGRMTNRDFHDAILRGGRIPVEMVRAMLTAAPPAREYRAQWKFYGERP
jgi:uncharacterized protein (DUF885 family)